MVMVQQYTLPEFSRLYNFFYDRIMEKNDFYKNPNVVTNSGNHYTISPYHVLWPVSQSEIDLKGYPGSDTNVAPLDKTIP